MTIDLYHVPGSAPCRAVRLAAAAVGVDLNLKFTDLMSGQHLKPEFLKLNPQHTVPTMDDNGFCLWESRAIMGYFVDQYGKNDSLYPKDPKSRALVNQRLYFDMGNLYTAFAEYYFYMHGGDHKDGREDIIKDWTREAEILTSSGPNFVINRGPTVSVFLSVVNEFMREHSLYPEIFAGVPRDPAKLEKIEQAFTFLDKFLEGENYVAGKHLTIADLATITTVSNFELMKFDLSPYKNVTKWALRVKAEAPKYEETNGAGLKAFQELIDKLSKKK